jgi:hypothetical protein
MKCINHPVLDAVGVCEKCGKGLCLDCRRELYRKTYCRDCADDLIHRTNEALGSNKHGLSWGLIFLGAFVITGLVLICGTGAAAMSALLFQNESTGSLVMAVTATACYMIGGFIVGAKAGYRGTEHGMSSALAADVVTLTIMLLGMLDSGVSAGWIVFSSIFVLLILPGFGALGGFLGERLRKR